MIDFHRHRTPGQQFFRRCCQQLCWIFCGLTRFRPFQTGSRFAQVRFSGFKPKTAAKYYGRRHRFVHLMCLAGVFDSHRNRKISPGRRKKSQTLFCTFLHSCSKAWCKIQCCDQEKRCVRAEYHEFLPQNFCLFANFAKTVAKWWSDHYGFFVCNFTLVGHQLLEKKIPRHLDY